MEVSLSDWSWWSVHNQIAAATSGADLAPIWPSLGLDLAFQWQLQFALVCKPKAHCCMEMESFCMVLEWCLGVDEWPAPRSPSACHHVCWSECSENACVDMRCVSVAECMCGHLRLLQNACVHICDTSVKVWGPVNHREAIYGFFLKVVRVVHLCINGCCYWAVSFIVMHAPDSIGHRIMHVQVCV